MKKSSFCSLKTDVDKTILSTRAVASSDAGGDSVLTTPSDTGCVCYGAPNRLAEYRDKLPSNMGLILCGAMGVKNRSQFAAAGGKFTKKCKNTASFPWATYKLSDYLIDSLTNKLINRLIEWLSGWLFAL